MKRRNWAVYVAVFVGVITLGVALKMFVLDHLGGDPRTAATITGTTMAGFWIAALIIANLASKPRKPSA